MSLNHPDGIGLKNDLRIAGPNDQAIVVDLDEHRLDPVPVMHLHADAAARPYARLDGLKLHVPDLN